MSGVERMEENLFPRGESRCLKRAAILGALFAAAAFLCALPYCRAEVRHWIPSVAYIATTSALAYLSAKRPRGTTMYCILIGLFALTLRLAWALSTAFPPPGDDYEHYRSVSLDLLHGNWEELYFTFWPWGHFLYLYTLAWLFGPSLLVPVTANAIVGSVTTLLVYAIARQICGERSARIAGVIYAAWPGVIYWSSVLCTEIPHLPLFLSSLACMLAGLQAQRRKALWLAAGGAFAALAEFVRPISLLLLLPFACYALMRKNLRPNPFPTSGNRRQWREVLIMLATYVVVLAALLAAASRASGFPHYAASYTLGMNLAFGLNWESRGSFNIEDAQALSAEDPREVNRRGLELAFSRLRDLWQNNQWRIPVLAAVKFQENWSTEFAAYDAVNYALPESQKANHWLVAFEHDFLLLGQSFHTLILAMGAIGFWRNRNSEGLGLLGGILMAFAALHIFAEVDGRYHFAAQSLLAIAAAAAGKLLIDTHPITKPAPFSVTPARTSRNLKNANRQGSEDLKEKNLKMLVKAGARVLPRYWLLSLRA